MLGLIHVFCLFDRGNIGAAYAAGMSAGLVCSPFAPVAGRLVKRLRQQGLDVGPRFSIIVLVFFTTYTLW